MAYALRRLALTLPILVVVAFVVFVVGELLPGDPAVARFDQHGDAEVVARWREMKGLDKPVPVRFGRYITGVVTEFDFGESYVDDREIGPMLAQRFAGTAELALTALLLAIPGGLLAGILSAVRRGRWPDYAGNVLALFGISIPIFWLGMVMTLAAKAVGFNKFQGRYSLLHEGVVGAYSTRFYLVESILRGEFEVAWSCAQHLLVPALALSTIPMAVITRMTRSSVLEEAQKDYVRTAKAKGLKSLRVVLHHVLRNALIPIITITGLQFGALLSGAVLTESVFSWPGLGTLILTAVQRSDSPMLVGGILLVAATFILVNLAVDLLYGVIDPRIRVGAGR